MIPLKTTLLINGASSGATGVALILFAEPIATLFGVMTTAPFMAVGTFLILFGTYVLAISTGRWGSGKAVRAIVAMDISWVVASAITLIIIYGKITVLGASVIVAVALWVSLMVYLQMRGAQLPEQG